MLFLFLRFLRKRSFNQHYFELLLPTVFVFPRFACSEWEAMGSKIAQPDKSRHFDMLRRFDLIFESTNREKSESLSLKNLGDAFGHFAMVAQAVEIREKVES